MQFPTISAAILTRNRLNQLVRCLHSLARQSLPLHEILVADTGSTDGTREWLAAFMAQRNLSENPAENPGRDVQAAGNLGQDAQATRDFTIPPALAALPLRWIADSGEGAFAGARNRAAEATSGEIIAFLDDDCEADRHWARRIAGRFAAEPDLDALGGVTLPAQELEFPAWWPPDMNWLLGLSGPGCWGWGAGTWELGQAANLAFRRSVWAEIPFQELARGDFAKGGRVYEAGREDAEWWRRVRQSGHRAAMDGRLIVWHDIDPARLDWDVARARARRDGATRWRRSPGALEIRAALSDLVHTPMRLADRVARQGIVLEQAVADCFLWGDRQAGLLAAAARDQHPAIDLGRVAPMVFVETARLAAGSAKAATRALGAPAYRALRRVRPLPDPEEHVPRSILLVACGFLGDQFLVQPALRLLRATYPDTRFVLLTSLFGEELYGADAPDEERRLVDETVNASDWTRESIPRREARLRKLLAAERPQAIAIFYAHDLWPLPLFFATDAPVVGFNCDMGFRLRLYHDLLTVCVEKDFSIHETLNHVRIARVLGASGVIEPFRLTIPEETQSRVDALLAEAGLAKFIAVHADTGLAYKEWPIERWLEVVRWIENETPFEVALIGGRGARANAERAAAEGLRARDFCGRLSIRATAALLRRSRLLVTGDSGPKHVAMAAGAPTLTLHGPSDERRWGARWDVERHATLRRGLPDLTGEDLRGLPDNHAMLLLQPEDVTARLAELLARPAAKNVMD